MRWLLCAAGVALMTSLNAADLSEYKTGKFIETFDEYSKLSHPSVISKRVKTKHEFKKSRFYKIEDESFLVYVPKTYKPWQPHGVFVWIDSSEAGGNIESWKSTYTEEKIIYVSARKTGNGTPHFERRVPLALDALHNIKKRYNVDPRRVYLGGFSGGGRVASMMAVPFADEIKGGVFVCGANFWKKVPFTGRKYYIPGWGPKTKYKSLAKKTKNRYVLLTGSKDFNKLNTQRVYEHGFKKTFKDNAKYLEDPNTGHSKPKAQYIKKAFDFCDERLKKEAKKLFSTAKSNQKRKKYAKAMQGYFLAGTSGYEEGFAKAQELADALQSDIAAAQELIDNKEYGSAHEQLTLLVKGYGDYAGDAALALKNLNEDETVVAEIKAGSLLKKAENLLKMKARKSRDKGKKMLKKVIADYAQTAAATEAQTVLETL